MVEQYRSPNTRWLPLLLARKANQNSFENAWQMQHPHVVTPGESLCLGLTILLDFSTRNQPTVDTVEPPSQSLPTCFSADVNRRPNR